MTHLSDLTARALAGETFSESEVDRATILDEADRQQAALAKPPATSPRGAARIAAILGKTDHGPSQKAPASEQRGVNRIAAALARKG